jgi:hypothetical protein
VCSSLQRKSCFFNANRILLKGHQLPGLGEIDPPRPHLISGVSGINLVIFQRRLRNRHLELLRRSLGKNQELIDCSAGERVFHLCQIATQPFPLFRVTLHFPMGDRLRMQFWWKRIVTASWETGVVPLNFNESRSGLLSTDGSSRQDFQPALKCRINLSAPLSILSI